MKFIVLISSYGESWFTYFFPFQWLAFITDYDHIFTYRQIKANKQTTNKYIDKRMARRATEKPISMEKTFKEPLPSHHIAS